MITLNIKPMSVNKAWSGRQHKSPYYHTYIREVKKSLIGIKNVEKSTNPFHIHYKFYLTKSNYNRSDVGNFEKPLTDILVKVGVINDDRYITKITLEKILSNKFKVEILIKEA